MAAALRLIERRGSFVAAVLDCNLGSEFVAGGRRPGGPKSRFSIRHLLRGPLDSIPVVASYRLKRSAPPFVPMLQMRLQGRYNSVAKLGQ